MKFGTVSLSLAFVLCAANLQGQGIGSDPSWKKLTRTVGSKLVIGMSQNDALKVLGTNGFADLQSDLGTSRWVVGCCYTNRLAVSSVDWQRYSLGPIIPVDLRLHFRSVRTQPIATNYEQMTRLMFDMLTNSFLTAAFTAREQIARTKSP